MYGRCLLRLEVRCRLNDSQVQRRLWSMQCLCPRRDSIRIPRCRDMEEGDADRRCWWQYHIKRRTVTGYQSWLGGDCGPNEDMVREVYSRALILLIIWRYQKYQPYGAEAADLIQMGVTVATVICPLRPRIRSFVGREDSDQLHPRVCFLM